MRSPSRADAGGAAAEFAVALPAVLLVLAGALAGVGVAALQVRAQDAAADAARLLGRGEGPGAVAAQLARQLPGASWTSSSEGDLVCVRIAVRGAGPAAAFGAIGASSCALDDG